MVITYEKFIDGCKIELSTNATGVLARVNIDFVNPPIIIKGFTIKDGISKEGEPYRCLSAPCYRSRNKYYPNIWLPETLWKMLSDKVLKEYESKLEGCEDINLEELEL